MKNNSSNHSHEEVAKRAEKIWHNYGKPVGRDVEIWHEAERQITSDRGTPTETKARSDSLRLSEPNDAAALAETITAAESVVEFNISPAIPDQEAIQAALQTKVARAPKVPRIVAPKHAVPESGKPLWNQPHSS